MRIRPLGNRVIIKRLEAEALSAGGIYIPETATEKPMRGEVLEVGPGKKHTETGAHQKMDVKKGDKVLFGKYSGTEVKVNGNEFVVMTEDDIMGVLEEA